MASHACLVILSAVWYSFSFWKLYLLGFSEMTKQIHIHRKTDKKTQNKTKNSNSYVAVMLNNITLSYCITTFSFLMYSADIYSSCKHSRQILNKLSPYLKRFFQWLNKWKGFKIGTLLTGLNHNQTDCISLLLHATF